MRDVTIRFQNVTFGFRRGRPLFDSLTVELQGGGRGGKIVALMGPSGVGKSTFCRLVLGTLRPHTGSVEFTPAEPRVAAIPQKGVLFEELSISQNIACLKYSSTLGRTFREERLVEATRMLGLESLVATKRLPSALSGGEAQRVMLARVQAVDCELLVLDEPCSSLDNRVKAPFLGALRRTVDAGRMLALMITHTWAEARLVADEVVFFHRNKNGTVTLHQAPVASLAASPPTVDAMYSIHWPECELMNRDDFHPVLTEQRAEFPDRAVFLGLFTNFGQPARNGLAKAVGQPFEHSVFFGDDEVAIIDL